MASITFAIPEEIKFKLSRFPWVNWSEIAREELFRQEKETAALKKVKKILSKSKFTEKDVKELSEKVKESMHKQLKANNLI